MNGALLIDKPQGITSAEVLRQLKRSCRITKLGHAGTLDPMASGLLIVLVGKATRLQSIFLESAKQYEGTISLGQRTSTDDIWGSVLEEDAVLEYRSVCSEAEWVGKIREKFEGEVEQVPPQVSAIKVNGKRSYELARGEEAVELSARLVSIHFEDLYFSDPQTLHYQVTCSKGTYIRSLARDIGEFLGSFGCVSEIRRVSSGSLSVADAVSLDTLSEDTVQMHMISPERLVAGIPRVEFSRDACRLLKNGVQSVLLDIEQDDQELLAVFSDGGEFQGVVERPPGSGWRVKCLLSEAI